MENIIIMKHKIIIKPHNVSGSLYVGFQSTFKKKKAQICTLLSYLGLAEIRNFKNLFLKRGTGICYLLK